MRRNPIALAAIFAVLVAAPALAAEQTRTLSHRLPAGALAKIQNLAGEVTIERTAGSEVTVQATVHADAGSAAATERLLTDLRWIDAAEGWSLSFPVDDTRAFAYPRRGGWGSSNTRYLGQRVKVQSRAGRGVPVLYADLTIGMPDGARVEIRNVVGGVSGDRLAGDLRVDTGSGDVTLRSFHGPLFVDTGSGDVRIGSLVGDGTVDTGSGDVAISSVDGARLDVDTGSGDVLVSGGRADRIRADTGSGQVMIDGVDVVDLEADTGSGDVTIRGALDRARTLRLDTGSGDVRILAGSDFSFDLVGDTGSGDVSVGYRDAALRRDGREIVGATRGDRRARILADTGSGDVILAPGD